MRFHIGHFFLVFIFRRARAGRLASGAIATLIFPISPVKLQQTQQSALNVRDR